MAVPEPKFPMTSTGVGAPIRRTESVAKVTGRLVYSADVAGQAPLHAYFLTSGIARGRLLSIDAAPAEALAGVVKVYTHRNAPPRIATPYTQKGGYASDTNMPLTGTEIRNDGQIVAMVVAETYEIARDASHRIQVRYTAEAPAATMDSPGADVTHPEALDEKEKKAGDFDAAFAAAPIRIEGDYRTPAQHQNPIELYSTTAAWSDGKLTIHEPSQFVVELANGAAAMMGVDPSLVRVVNPFMAGAFGGKGFMTQRTALVTGAARDLGRPVRNVVTRDQMFTLATYRSETRHLIRLAADREGHLLAYGHESWEMQSRQDDYPLAGFGVTTAMYGKPAIKTRVNMVKADRQTSGFMRAPVEMPYMYALESAMDELAVALGMDPIELRRVNDIRESRGRWGAVHQPITDAVLRRGGGDLRLERARSAAGLDAGRRLAGRLRLRRGELPDPHGSRNRAGHLVRAGKRPRGGRRAGFWPGYLHGSGPDRRPGAAARSAAGRGPDGRFQPPARARLQ